MKAVAWTIAIACVLCALTSTAFLIILILLI